MTYQYSFQDCLARSERITWRVEDLIGGDKTLDFSKPFMPESFARVAELNFLSTEEKRTLNQIRGHTYLAMFGLIEEFILPFVMDHAGPLIVKPMMAGNDYQARAYLEFAAEEAKHIHLFRRFRDEFAKGFGTRCDVIGPPEAVGKVVLAKPALSISLLVLMIEWMTQRHFMDSMKDDQSMDPQFKSLLLHHWMEEHQHAQLDALMTLAIAEKLSDAEIHAGIDGFFELGVFFDEGLKQQTAFDLDAMERAIGRKLGEADRAQFLSQQHQANRWTYLGSGLTHPRFIDVVEQIAPTRKADFEAAAPVFS